MLPPDVAARRRTAICSPEKKILINTPFSLYLNYLLLRKRKNELVRKSFRLALAPSPCIALLSMYPASSMPMPVLLILFLSLLVALSEYLQANLLIRHSGAITAITRCTTLRYETENGKNERISCITKRDFSIFLKRINVANSEWGDEYHNVYAR